MYGTQMYDIILFLFTCKTHQKVVLKKTAKKGAFDVPFYPLKLCKFYNHLLCTMFTTLHL